MKIVNLTGNSKNFTSNVYLVLGSNNEPTNFNTLIDVGCEPDIFQGIQAINTRLGKNKIDQVILTHSHMDHAALLDQVKRRYKPMVYAFNPQLKHVDVGLKDGDLIKIGDRIFEVYSLSFHSHDSICLYCEEEEALFSGDTSFPIIVDNAALLAQNERPLKRLFSKKITIVFPGHGAAKVYDPSGFKLIRKVGALQ